MAIGVKVLERPIEQTSYVRATLSGMALTLKHLFEGKVTIQYPEQKAYLVPRYRGRIILSRDPDGGERCVACDASVQALPVKASVQTVAPTSSRFGTPCSSVTLTQCP